MLLSCNFSWIFHKTFHEKFLKSKVFRGVYMNFSWNFTWIFHDSLHEFFMATLLQVYMNISQNPATNFLLCIYMLLSYPAFGQWPTKLVTPRFVNGDFDKPRNERFQRGLTMNFWTNRGLSVPKLTNSEGNISLWPSYWQTPTETLKWSNKSVGTAVLKLIKPYTNSIKRYRHFNSNFIKEHNN